MQPDEAFFLCDFKTHGSNVIQDNLSWLLL